MFENIQQYLSNSAEWMPQGYSIEWTPSLFWTHVFTDLLTAAAYYSIPLALIYIAWHRNDLPFRKIYLMLGAFILACGTSHLISIVLLWKPIYWLDAIIHAITAFLSLGTAFFVIRLIPLLKQSSLPTMEKTIYEALLMKGDIDLSSMQARFNNTTQLAPVGIINVSTNSDILEVNPKFCNFIGYSHDEILNMNLEDISCEDCYSQYATKISQCLSGEISEFEEKCQYRHKKGHVIWGALHVKLIRHKDSRLDYFILIVEDISLQKNLQDNLTIQSMAVNQSPSPVMITNLNKEIKYVNPAFLRHTGYLFSEVIGQNSQMFFSEKTSPETYSEMWSTLMEFKPWKGELINKSKQGKETVDLTEVIPIATADGIIDHYLVLKEDITARKETELALITATKAAESLFESKSLFMANMSHEIRTPISVIMGFTELALIKDMPDNIRDYLCKIKTASMGLRNILNDILDFSKLEADKITIVPELFDLTLLKDELYSFFKSSADKKGLLFTTDIAADTPLQLIGDEQRIKQILINLISNAIKFTDYGYVKLNISALSKDAKQAKLLFSVQDSGIGITEEDQTHLFQVFNQIDNSITRRYGGTGLGLSLSKNLLHLMGGEFKVSSELGEGSFFSFEIVMDLPTETIAYPTKQAESLAEINSDPDSEYTNTRILVVEDNLFNQQIIEEILALAGFSVELADNGKVALDLLEQYEFDAIVMDAHMPIMDGFEATTRIRSQTRFDKMPIIALTAGVSQDERIRCLEVGMDDFLNKPINGRLLISTLKQHLNSEIQNKPQLKKPEPATVATTEISNNENRLNVDILKKEIGEDPAKVAKFLNFFQKSSQEICAEIITAIRSQQIDAVHTAAHKLKSAARTVGAIDLGDLCVAIEDAAIAGDSASLNTLSQRFEEEWTEVNKLLQAWAK